MASYFSMTISSHDFANKTDEEIVPLVLENQNDFSYLVHRYQDKLSRYIHRLSNLSQEEIEDMLQNIFIKAYLNLNDFDSSLKFSSWIYRIAHNEVIDNYRRSKARPKLLDSDISDGQAKELAGDFDLFADVVESELRAKINEAISQLDSKYREVLILKFIEDKDYQEISDIIKKPMGTVASRINKAKIQLRRQLVNKSLL